MKTSSDGETVRKGEASVRSRLKLLWLIVGLGGISFLTTSCYDPYYYGGHPRVRAGYYAYAPAPYYGYANHPYPYGYGYGYGYAPGIGSGYSSYRSSYGYRRPYYRRGYYRDGYNRGPRYYRSTDGRRNWDRRGSGNRVRSAEGAAQGQRGSSGRRSTGSRERFDPQPE